MKISVLSNRPHKQRTNSVELIQITDGSLFFVSRGYLESPLMVGWCRPQVTGHALLWTMDLYDDHLNSICELPAEVRYFMAAEFCPSWSVYRRLVGLCAVR
mmetsp:Transcript_37421/g.90953  ORF Transcript_37421/g.90953 Transcript_37421/m.90953 type:complete len:101 (+) Transcript_37421:1867-2169(+)